MYRHRRALAQAAFDRDRAAGLFGDALADGKPQAGAAALACARAVGPVERLENMGQGFRLDALTHVAYFQNNRAGTQCGAEKNHTARRAVPDGVFKQVGAEERRIARGQRHGAGLGRMHGKPHIAQKSDRSEGPDGSLRLLRQIGRLFFRGSAHMFDAREGQHVLYRLLDAFAVPEAPRHPARVLVRRPRAQGEQL